MGVPVVEAPTEAEAQCAEMAKSGLVYGLATEDMDALTFGAPRVIRHLMAPSSQNVSQPAAGRTRDEGACARRGARRRGGWRGRNAERPWVVSIPHARTRPTLTRPPAWTRRHRRCLSRSLTGRWPCVSWS